MLAPRGNPRGHRVQVVIGRLVPAAVGDEEDGGLMEGLAHRDCFSSQEMMSGSSG